MGRGLVREDETWGRHRVVVLTDGLWRRRFGRDPGIVGQNVTLNGEPHVVAGVLSPNFSFLATAGQLVMPMSFAPGDSLNSHSNYFLRMIGRLRTDITKEQAEADLNGVLQGIIAKESINEGSALELTSLHEALVGEVRRPVLVLLGAVGFVLLISCANLANLLLARGIVRQREIAVRLAVGATRRRLFGQFLIESVLLSVAGGLLGLGLAYVSTDALNLLSPSVLPRAEAIRVDRTVLFFVFGVSVATGMLLGLAPAIHSIVRDVAEGLKDSARTVSDTKGRHRLRATLVIAEVALSLVLLAGAGLMVKSMYQLLNVETGFQADGVLTMQMTLPQEKYVDLERSRRLDPTAYVKATAFFGEVIQQARGVPGAQVVGAINGLPLMGEIWGKYVTFFDRPLPKDLAGLSPIQYRLVAGDYFRALGIRVRSGRAFTDDDTLEAPRVAIVNREMARRHYGDR
ncbi:MAG: ABC transporter permease, partial [Vicinamibacterales bacterium]